MPAMPGFRSNDFMIERKSMGRVSECLILHPSLGWRLRLSILKLEGKRAVPLEENLAMNL